MQARTASRCAPAGSVPPRILQELAPAPCENEIPLMQPAVALPSGQCGDIVKLEPMVDEKSDQVGYGRLIGLRVERDFREYDLDRFHGLHSTAECMQLVPLQIHFEED